MTFKPSLEDVAQFEFPAVFESMYQNALSPMSVTESGITSEPILHWPSSAYCPIDLIFASNETELSTGAAWLRLVAKANSPM